MTATARELDLSKVHLISGHGHKPKADAALEEVQGCVMDMVAWAAGEAWSDHPKCASPVITAFCIRWNDAMSDEDRQQLVPYIPRLIGTRGDRALELKRVYMCTDWSVHTAAPAWLRRAGLEDQAALLDALPPVVDRETAQQARAQLVSVRNVAYSSRAKAWAKAYEASEASAAYAAYAAYAASEASEASAAYAASEASEAYAASEASEAYEASEASAVSAAYAAYAAYEASEAYEAYAAYEAYEASEAYAAYEAYAREALRPTVVELQKSALGLLDRLIAAGAEAA